MCLFYCCISILSSHSVLLPSLKEEAVIERLLTLEKQLRKKKDVVVSLLAGSSCPQQMWQHAKFVWFREEISLLFAAKIPVAKFGRSKCWYIWCYSRRENVYCCSLWHHQHNRYVRNQVRFLKCFKTYYTSLLYGSYWSDYITRGHAIRTNIIYHWQWTATMRNNQQETIWKLFEIHELMTAKQYLAATMNHTYVC